MSDFTYRSEGRKRNLIISVCIKLSRKFEILDFLREQILSKNLGESPRTGNTFYQLSEDIQTSRFSTPPSCALFLGRANISSAKCYFFVPGYLTLCLSVSASVSYLLRLCKGYLPETRGYVIYSPGTTPRATYKKLFLFRFSIPMQQKIAFS